MTSTWQPLADGESVHCACGDGRCSARLVPDDDIVHIHNTLSASDQCSLHLPNNRRLCERVEPEPITPEALERDGWEYMLWNGVIDEWYKQFAPPRAGHSNCVGVRFKERKDVPPEKGTVYLHLTSNYMPVRNCKTMTDLDNLMRYLSDEESLAADT